VSKCLDRCGRNLRGCLVYSKEKMVERRI